MTGRYRASGREAEYQAGSDGRVLRNRLGIAAPDEMDEVELNGIVRRAAILRRFSTGLRVITTR